jgi:peptide/nickel transport system substrate-binding protein
MHMRCDAGPFVDKRVRQALALTIDRQAFIDGVLGGAVGMGLTEGDDQTGP